MEFDKILHVDNLSEYYAEWLDEDIVADCTKYESLVEQIKTCLEDQAVSQQEIDQYSVAPTVFAHLDC